MSVIQETTPKNNFCKSKQQPYSPLFVGQINEILQLTTNERATVLATGQNAILCIHLQNS
jgi:hypothetical protein